MKNTISAALSAIAIVLPVPIFCDIIDTYQGRYYLSRAGFTGGISLILRATTDYAIRIMAFLAKSGKVASSTDIADYTKISPKYIIKVAAILRDSDLIVSLQGAGGGYTLARPADEITIYDILKSVDSELRSDNLSIEPNHSAPDAEECMLAKQMFEEINLKLRDYFSSQTLLDFVNKSRNDGGKHGGKTR